MNEIKKNVLKKYVTNIRNKLEMHKNKKINLIEKRNDCKEMRVLKSLNPKDIIFLIENTYS